MANIPQKKKGIMSSLTAYEVTPVPVLINSRKKKMPIPKSKRLHNLL
ncbi:MAG: hypothetical protein ROZ36_15670 [Thermincola sp.]|nr:hypothetical protein [Thermincola sp.]